jgi:hypothetical protein
MVNMWYGQRGVSRVPLDFAAFSRLAMTNHYHEQDISEYAEVEASVKQVLKKRAETHYLRCLFSNGVSSTTK